MSLEHTDEVIRRISRRLEVSKEGEIPGFDLVARGLRPKVRVDETTHERVPYGLFRNRGPKMTGKFPFSGIISMQTLDEKNIIPMFMALDPLDGFEYGFTTVEPAAMLNQMAETYDINRRFENIGLHAITLATHEHSPMYIGVEKEVAALRTQMSSRTT